MCLLGQHSSLIIVCIRYSSSIIEVEDQWVDSTLYPYKARHPTHPIPRTGLFRNNYLPCPELIALVLANSNVHTVCVCVCVCMCCIYASGVFHCMYMFGEGVCTLSWSCWHAAGSVVYSIAVKQQ